MENSRRSFLKGSCALIAGAGAYSVVASGTDVKGKSYGLLHDETKCIGCEACTYACHEVNNVPEGVDRLKIIRSGPYQDANGNTKYHFFRKSCQQCADSPCVTVCPTGAAFIDKETGIVDVNATWCVGCQYCIAACPYQVRYIDPVKKSADKCNFCRDTNLANNKLPGCVEICPTKALVFGDLNDEKSEIVKIIKTHPVYRSKVGIGTKPRVFRIPTVKGEVEV